VNQHIADQVDNLIAQRPGKTLLEPEYTDEAIKINDFIYGSGGTSSAYMIVTPAGRIIVNTGCGFEGPHHRKLFDDIYSGPTRYIITTQGHTDHVGGVHAFREPGAVYVANELNQSVQLDDARVIKRMRQWAPVWFGRDADTVARFATEFPSVSNAQDEPVPDLTFKDRLGFTVGGLDIELYSGVGETVDGAMVWLPQHRIAMISNLLGPLFGHFPNLNTVRGQRYRFAEPYLQTIRKLRDLRPKTLITGRGEPIEGEELIDAVLKRMYDAVDYVHRTTLDGINAGKSVETLMREITLPPALYVGQGYGQVKWGVKTIWETYLGWFHHDSTTALYDLPRAKILADLVELAGVERAIELAETRLAEGAVVEATALSEAVLAFAPDNVPATRVLLACHRELLTQPSTEANFWESGWLAHQIKKLEATVAESDTNG
jgi:alkyl sulfatase BDS1-like metallo-beta-lactamase superfamily hydrolase